ncbi:MAG TPA: M3 family metallopeptidase, partial [Kofleriaceae bacterium]|nr:M3 family metallopeptidase [Kofleriaceae bacterium]
MQRRTFLLSAASSAVLLSFKSKLSFAKGGEKMPSEPLLAPWTGPYGGVPPFNKIQVKDFKPALKKGMDLSRADIKAIAESKDAATFENTIAALEDSGRAFSRCGSMFGTFTSTMNSKPMQTVEKEMAPVIAAFSDEITQNEALFARIKTVYDGRAKAKLTPEQNRLVEVTYQNFARKGASLGAKEKARLKEINQKLATLFTSFSQNVLADEEGQEIVLDKEADLAGLPESLRASMKTAAEGKKLKGKWLISNTRSSAEPFLTYSSRRDLREKVFRMWSSRGESADHNNLPVMTEILALRGERAKLLGFKTHAHWIIDDNMAKTPDAAMALMMKVWKAATARVKEEVADMQKVADAEKAGHKIEAWDYRYYAEKVRKAKYDLDQDEVKAYLQLDKLRDAMFWAAGQLYGLEFKPIKGVPVYHKDVTTYEVVRGGKHVGLWYFDPYARAGKRSGAWMSEYRTQEGFKTAVAPIVSNNSNFVKGKAGTPVLISWDDATTMFHEFGHALHGLNSEVNYPTLAGTNTKRDFVEFPSQLNEHWLTTPEVLNKFCVHYQTGKPMPPELVAKIEKAKNFNQGFKTVEYLAAAIYDLRIHMTPTDKPIDPAKFEQTTMKEIGCPTEIVMRHRPPAFLHIFSDDAYSAGYYVYIWADTLTADAAEAFVEAKSFYDKATAKKLHDNIMSVGNSIPPDVAFRQFRGRDVDTDALMRD